MHPEAITVIREETGKFVEAGNKVAAEAGSFYGLVVQSDYEFYATVVATSPACPVPELSPHGSLSLFPPVTLYGYRGIADLYQGEKLDMDAERACADYRADLSRLRNADPKVKESWVEQRTDIKRGEPTYACRRAIACLDALPATVAS